ncbi:carbamoyltransferase HypF [Pseudenhygromyxa sp. WMMC2535]|uniref:carbamoyltransferase HypF n=1 Tax=Pseudenhygromyxa sp. WMMC2535 TaxID=2712867 RepID=UPI0015547373|nr:carbamoyltransferase HypF [Pseudenhygromyxa sp. WMMC2535]NVB40879.1 carbamoyltransferase HypF [Pseudenhygromyxa sp. WMMC2535]
MAGERVRIRGAVQGVGFRPTAARVARRMGLQGWVRNDAAGVEIALMADGPRISAYLEALTRALPPLARIDALERSEDPSFVADGFMIVASEGEGAPRAVVTVDAAACAACLREVLDPLSRRYRYPFTTCTHCGPRYSIVERIPYDRENTTMAGFPMCAACRAEYEDEDDRRFHAEPVACFACGPRAALRRMDGRAFSADAFSMMDEVDAVATLLARAEIVAIKGLGGYQLCCDATSDAAVAKLRERKLRPDQPFALMVRDLDVARRYAELDAGDEALLTSPAGPIVLLRPRVVDARPLCALVAPEQPCVGVMLPTTPLHHLIMRRLDRPVVCTSGNLHSEPQCLTPAEVDARLAGVADWALDHDRPIAHRVDDSVVRRMAGAPRVLRRARGYAPSWMPLVASPDAPAILAVGAQDKATFAISQGDRVLLSPHLGDLDSEAAFTAYLDSFAALSELYAHRPQRIAIDRHHGYRSAQWGRQLAAARGLEVIEVQHHHAHIAACLAENGWRPAGADDLVLGIALDGLGMGLDGELWGGELLLARYEGFERVASLKPVALLGGDKASREPWRNLYAQLMAEMGWAELDMNFAHLPVVQDLAARPRDLLDSMLRSGTRCPTASSCGRLFDAAAAALDLHRDAISFEGQAAMALEALVTPATLEAAREGEHYPMATPKLGGDGLPYLEPLGLWRAMLGDLHAGIEPSLIAARFHVAVADGLILLAMRAQRQHAFRVAALSGGCFQNALLLALVVDGLRGLGLEVLTHTAVPPNDGCIALGQAAIAAAGS